MLRYCLRPPAAQGRLSWSSEDHGEVVLRLKRPMADGQSTLRMAGLRAVNVFAIHLLGDGISPALIGLLSDATGSLAIAIGLHALPMLGAGVVLLGGPRLLLREAPHAASLASR